MQLSDPKIYSDQEIILKAQIHGMLNFSEFPLFQICHEQ